MFARVLSSLRGESRFDRIMGQINDGALERSINTRLDDYQYEPLLTKSSIRILALDRPRPQDQGRLRGRILVTELESFKDSYYALSYVWGDPGPTREIIIWGTSTSVKINENLYQALSSFTQTPRVGGGLWADAVCIDQKNIHERNQQVALMGQIYASAIEVFICLRASGPDLERINKLLLRMLWLKNKPRLIKKTPGRRLIHVAATDQFPDQTRFGFPAPESPDWDVLKVIRQDPWFGRCWTLQECLLAKKLWVATGSYRKEFNMSLLADVETSLLAMGVISGQNNFDATHQRYMERMWALDSNKPKKPLIDLLHQSANLEATDERDLLFSLLGLAEEGDAPNLAADYNETVDQARLRFAKYIVKRGHGNALLHMCFDKDAHARLPSWVPQRWGLGYADDRYRVKYAVPQVSENIQILDEHQNILSVRGQNFGTIERVGKMTVNAAGLIQEHSDRSLAEKIHAWHSDAMDLLSKHSRLYSADWPVDEYTISWQILWTGHGTLLPNLQFVDDRDKMTDFAQFVRWRQWPEDWSLSPRLERRLSELESMLQQYMGNILFATLACRRLYSTQHGMMGLADLTCMPGDILFSPDGEAIRVLRPVDGVMGAIPAYRIIGHAAMYRPELLTAKKELGVPEEEIYVV